MAKPNNTEAKVLPILEPIIAEKGLELVDLEFVKGRRKLVSACLY